MIITKLIGGLGNQMFQYSAGRRTAIANNTELKLDITGYENQVGMIPRKYALNIFNIQENFAKESEINKLKKSSFISRFFKKNTYIKEKHFHFDPKILFVRNNSYLEGWWQSQKYFKDIKDVVRQDFRFKFKPYSKNKKLIDKINNTMSVSIHIRRSDYVLDKRTNEHHGFCDLDYYLRAVTLITKRINKPQFFVFSDDIKWAKQNLRLKFPSVYVDYNFGNKDYEDMRLMSLCRHNIIANSSFSWWGAWLNQNKDKIVITPKKWFRDKSINTKDLLPNSWIKI